MMHLPKLLPVMMATAIVLSPSVVLAEEFTVTQTNKTFRMNGEKLEKLTIKVGDSIRFLNEDPFLHNVFSLSDIKNFDLGSYPKGESKSVTFDKPGQAEIECSVHPQMRFELEVK
jgi:plastocyanin